MSSGFGQMPLAMEPSDGAGTTDLSSSGDVGNVINKCCSCLLAVEYFLKAQVENEAKCVIYSWLV